MKKAISVVTSFTILLFVASAIAADKVVVVPLATERTINTQLDNVVVSTSWADISHNSSAYMYSPLCPTGYRLSSGGYQWSHFDAGLRVVASYPNSNGTRWYVTYINTSGLSRSLKVYALCLKVSDQ